MAPRATATAGATEKPRPKSPARRTARGTLRDDDDDVEMNFSNTKTEFSDTEADVLNSNMGVLGMETNECFGHGNEWTFRA